MEGDQGGADDVVPKAKPKEGGGGGSGDAAKTTEMKRTCSCCKKGLCKSSYSKAQWKKNDSAKCKRCVTQTQVKEPVSKLKPLESTEAYRDHMNNSISPKDRLVKYCEISCVIDLGKANGGIIPEKIIPEKALKGRRYINTPYAYWGLPSKGSLFGSNEFKTEAKERCEKFRKMGFDWLVENAELVMPYFEEVATDGFYYCNGFVSDVKWEVYVDLVKKAVARKQGNSVSFVISRAETFGSRHGKWQRPRRTETAAFVVRSSNSITPKDRLVEYCELSSLSYAGFIEPERRLLSFPPRRTTNRYWGISPKGGRSAADNSTWSHFMDSEMNWIRSNAELVQPHLDEVASMGYPATIATVRFVMMALSV